MLDIPMTLAFLRPGELWTLDGDDYSGLTWHSDTPKPTEAEIAAAWPAAQAARVSAAAEKDAARAALLQRLGITEDEAALLLGVRLS